MTTKQQYWLRFLVDVERTNADIIPNKIWRWMDANGFAVLVSPNNPAHKDKLVITEAGKAALK